MVRGSDGTWSDPAFYTLAGASIGLQIGGEVSEAVFTLMTDEAVASLLQSEFKFGGDISVAVGPKGALASARRAPPMPPPTSMPFLKPSASSGAAP